MNAAAPITNPNRQRIVDALGQAGFTDNAIAHPAAVHAIDGWANIARLSVIRSAAQEAGRSTGNQLHTKPVTYLRPIVARHLQALQAKAPRSDAEADARATADYERRKRRGDREWVMRLMGYTNSDRERLGLAPFESPIDWFAHLEQLGRADRDLAACLRKVWGGEA